MSTCLQILYKHAIDIIKNELDQIYCRFNRSSEETFVFKQYNQYTIQIAGFLWVKNIYSYSKKNTIEDIKCVC